MAFVIGVMHGQKRLRRQDLSLACALMPWAPALVHTQGRVALTKHELDCSHNEVRWRGAFSVSTSAAQHPPPTHTTCPRLQGGNANERPLVEVISAPTTACP